MSAGAWRMYLWVKNDANSLVQGEPGVWDHWSNQNHLFRRIPVLCQRWRSWLSHLADFNH
ncbi:hypothetical protein T06_13875 [Trichinella sp. T6]|nr:hypothetical protein T06_13875 [Trichinella sp. T6]